MIKKLLSFLIFIISFPTLAQTPAQEFLRTQEQMKKSQLMRVLDSGVYFMDNGQYTNADAKFLYVLQNIRSVPSELTYYFGKNSFYLGKYKQSIDWLNKYLQLKGTSGQFSNDAGVLMRQAGEELLKENAVVAQTTEHVHSNNYDIDCGPSGKVVCPICKGDHVIIKKGPFNDEYKTCPYCNDHGILTCEEYNKLMRGELKAKTGS